LPLDQEGEAIRHTTPTGARKRTAYLFALVFLFLPTYARGSVSDLSLQVLPVRVIVVYSDGDIEEVTSNSSGNVYPVVRLGDDDGQTLVADAWVNQQYAFIEGSINFSRAGVVWSDQDLLSYYPASMSDGRFYPVPFEMLLLSLAQASHAHGSK
jgi:hypothetical protein